MKFSKDQMEVIIDLTNGRDEAINKVLKLEKEIENLKAIIFAKDEEIEGLYIELAGEDL